MVVRGVFLHSLKQKPQNKTHKILRLGKHSELLALPASLNEWATDGGFGTLPQSPSRPSPPRLS